MYIVNSCYLHVLYIILIAYYFVVVYLCVFLSLLFCAIIYAIVELLLNISWGDVMVIEVLTKEYDLLPLGSVSF